MAQKNNSSNNDNPDAGLTGQRFGAGVFGSSSNAARRSGKINSPGGYRGKNTPMNPAASWRRFNP